jgi:hypothetical protein
MACTSSAAVGGFPGRPAGLPGPGPAGGRAGLLPICGRLELRAGPGGGRAGPSRARDPTSGVRRQAGGRLRGLPTSGCRAPPVLSSPFRVAVLPCLLASVGVSVALTMLRGSPGAGRRERCFYAFARLSRSLVAPRGPGRAGSWPFFLLLAVGWPGQGPGRRLHRRPEPLGVSELTRPAILA